VLGRDELTQIDDDLRGQMARQSLAVLARGAGAPTLLRSGHLRRQDDRTAALWRSSRIALFGRFLVSLPYVDSASGFADDESIADELIDKGVGLADRLKVRYLELRQEQATSHPSLKAVANGKIMMRLPLPILSQCALVRLRL